MWKDDNKQSGLRLVHDCLTTDDVKQNGNFDIYTMLTIYEESLNIMINEVEDEELPTNEHYITVAVFCGSYEESCPSRHALKGTRLAIDEVVTVWACPGIEEDSFDGHVAEEMDACLKQVQDNLAAAENYVRAVIIDPSMPFAMGQILYKIYASERRMRKIFL